ncbi:hypothetical protein AJ78_01158 [Emergomyces pasteurianus Ep9510]|uniref:DNA polymerase epsilon subunit D n=1 Tax=Emergomyces pasteurianus Ep9510 TaxID=1447872 RepID=A0A1J9PSD5_9EURO|nr:hypothetical protein AJ78_01158 [Emergomyces pasteurianus Ep9510]
MPPRKSTSSAAEAGSHDDEQNAVVDGSKTTGSGTDPIETGVNVEDYLLPRALTQRLAKGALPPNTSIQKDALLAISKAATVFVSYLSSHANEETEKKTITPQDVFAALSQIEFDAFLPRLERELAVYTEATAQKRRGKKDRKSANAAAATTGLVGAAGGARDTGISSVADETADVDDGVEPGAKRVKRDGEGDTEIAIGRPRPGVGGRKGVEVAMEGRGGDGDETEDMEEEDALDDEEEEEEEEEADEEEEEGEEEEEEEEEGDATQQNGRDEDEIDIDADASDTARRRKGAMNPDLDSGLESDSDGL